MFWDRITRAAKPSGVPESGVAGHSGDTLPLRNPMFTGRTEVLEILEQRLAAGPVAVVALRGLGGVGKSQLVLEYAHQKRQSGRYQLAGWIRADSTVTIAEDLASLAPLLGLSEQTIVGDTAAKVVSALRSRQDWLLVFDNASRPGDLKGMLPSGGGHVLITSRSREWSGTATQLDLSEFRPAESVRFLCKRSGSDELEAAMTLAEELGDLPLALAQAAAYIDARSMTIREYLELYRDPVLAQRLRDSGLDSAEYPASVARTWLLSFTQLSGEHPAAVELLRLCAFLDPDDIDLELLSAGREETGEVLCWVLGDRLGRIEAVGALASSSLATVPVEGHLRVHRLVQAVTRDQLDDGQAVEWVKRTLNLAEAIQPPEPADYRSWPVYASLAPHIEAVAEHASSYPDLGRDISSLLWNLGIYLSASGQLRAARTTFERVLAINEAVYGPEHLEVARALNNLGIVQTQLGELGDARTTFERTLALKEAALGPGDPDVGVTLTNLGIVEAQLGELDDARKKLERGLAMMEAGSSPDHPSVGRILIHLGSVEAQLGELDDARTSTERGLAIYEAAYGPNHLDVVIALMDLSIIQLQQWKLMDARTSIIRAAPAINEAIALYGEDLLKTKVGGSFSKKPTISRFVLFLFVAIGRSLAGGSGRP